MTGSSGTTKRPDHCSNSFLRVSIFDQNCAQMFNILNWNLYKNTIQIGVSNKMREGKTNPQMTNLKAGSGSTSEPVQGPHSSLILGVARWSSNRLFVDPEPSLKGPLSAERNILVFCGPRTGFWQGVKWACIRLSSIYIYILFFPFHTLSLFLSSCEGVLAQCALKPMTL